MSWAFSKSLPDNQEGLGFSFLYPWRSPFELSHSKLDIPVPDHTTFWTDGCITLVQIKKNLKVVKKRLEDCMLKKIRAWVERNLPTNTHTVSWQSHWLFYQNSNVPAYFFTVFVPPVMAAVPLKCSRGVSPLKTARPFWLRKRHRSDSIVSLSPPRYQGKKGKSRNFFPGLCNRCHWQFRATRLHSVTNWYLATGLVFKEPANHDLLLSNDKRTVRNFSRINVSGKKVSVQMFKEAHFYKKHQQVLTSINKKNNPNSVITPLFCWKYTWFSNLWQCL